MTTSHRKSLMALAISIFLAVASSSAAQTFDQNLTIDSPISFTDEEVLIRADGSLSPVIQVIDGGSLGSPGGIRVTDDSTLVLDGGFLADFVTVEDHARFVLLGGQMERVWEVGDVPGLLPVLIATDSASLELHSSVPSHIHMSGESIAEIVGRDLEVTIDRQLSTGARLVRIDSGLLPDGSRDLSVTLMMRENASFLLNEVPEPSAALMLSCTILSLFAYRALTQVGVENTD